MSQPRQVFPTTRLRRTRFHTWSRRLVAEHHLSVNDLIWPLFVKEGDSGREPISSMPGVYRHTIPSLVEAVKAAQAQGIPAVALFPVTPSHKKTSDGREACNPDNLVCRAIRAVKSACPEMGVIADVALDPYTSHGHDGVVIDGDVANDETVAILVEQALVQVAAGCDVIAPSDMQDGRIGRIRHALEQANYKNTLILAYAAKYASSFYGPFRDAVDSQSQLGSKGKHSYQQDPANSNEALREVAMDIEEGADLIMIKPGLPYLDVVSRVKQTFQMPTFVYQVSGEYSMVQAAAQQGWLNAQATFLECLLSMKRAGADAILTYAAYEIATLLNDTTHG